MFDVKVRHPGTWPIMINGCIFFLVVYFAYASCSVSRHKCYLNITNNTDVDVDGKGSIYAWTKLETVMSAVKVMV